MSSAGLPPTTGVRATTDKEVIFGLGADVVVHAASKAHAVETNAEDICRLLASGTNVITTTSYNHLPTYGADDRGGLRRGVSGRSVPLPRRGRESRASCSSGWSTTITGLSKSIDRIDLYEAVDVSASTVGRCSSI